MNSEIKEILGNDIASIFDRMEMAEQVIKEMKREFPAKTKNIHDSFKYLAPTVYFHGKSHKLYRSHCREIILRIINNSDISFGTNAEIAGLLCDLSQSAPLNHDYAYVYQIMFKKIFGNVFTDDVPLINESYEGRSKEIISHLRKKLKTKRN